MPWIIDLGLGPEMISIHERRRRAPLGYWAKADNARFVAFLLSKGLPKELDLDNVAKLANYGGTASIAINETYIREAAIALELIVKAVIAQKIEYQILNPNITKVPMTHDVLKLWEIGELPEISVDDQRLLLLVKSILTWSGRYAAPTKDKIAYQENEMDSDLLKKYDPPSDGRVRIKRRVFLDWTNFDRLYGISLKEFRAARALHE